MKDFLKWLSDFLRPHYTPPAIAGGHDWTHVERLITLASGITRFLNFNMDEFQAAAWLHNLDRATNLKEVVKINGGLKAYCLKLLSEGPFDEDAQERIVDAVLQHNKKDDEPGDSTLLQALRIADKVDRFGPLGIMAISAHQGPNLISYDPHNPFGYDSTAEDKLKSVYNNFMRVLEWYGMLPSAHARALIRSERNGVLSPLPAGARRGNLRVHRPGKPGGGRHPQGPRQVLRALPGKDDARLGLNRANNTKALSDHKSEGAKLFLEIFLFNFPYGEPHIQAIELPIRLGVHFCRPPVRDIFRPNLGLE